MVSLIRGLRKDKLFWEFILSKFSRKMGFCLDISRFLLFIDIMERIPTELIIFP
jgi:hypothetical protein